MEKEITTQIQIKSNSTPYKNELFELYCLWKSLPYQFKVPPKDKATGQRPNPREFCEMMGIEDLTIWELAEIRTQAQFAEKYDLDPTTLVLWNRNQKLRDNLADMRMWAKHMSRSILMSLGNNAMRKGLSFDVKLWFQLVEGWEEKQKVEHNYQGVQVVEILDAEYKDTVETNKETTNSVEVLEG